MTDFPTDLPDLTRPAASDTLGTPGVFLDVILDAISDELEAVAAKVGADGSAVTTSHDYLLANSVVLKALFNANTILAATTDDTPAALTVGESTIVGRASGGNIAALTAAQALTILGFDLTGIAQGSVLYYDGSNVVDLGIGTAGKVLTVNAGATAPEWADAAGGSAFVGARAFLSGSAQSISNSTHTALALNGESFDSDTMHDTATNNSRLTIPVGMDGKWQFVGSAEFAANATGYRQVTFRQNGSTFQAFNAQVGTSVFDQVLQVTDVMTLTAGDYIELMAYQSSGGNLNVNAGETKTFLTATYLGA